MHTRHFDEFTFHYNGDMSGDVHIVYTPEPPVLRSTAMGPAPERVELHVPGAILLAFIAERVAMERVCELEDDPARGLGWPERVAQQIERVYKRQK